MAIQIKSTNEYTNIISVLDNEFTLRFGDFQKLSSDFNILSTAFISDFDKELGALQPELIDMQCDSTLKGKFQSESIDKFYATPIESKFINLRNMAIKLLVFLGTTYIC
ncbi:hypothetical protein RF11_06246 [Thelohanellus kitauei]|uniref:General transcription factor II-I repeat domain-containing protein 2 n=1 Tax=Thelohanellus kitauei TaxID=669202 RepID=A0A0C2IEK6_THEKT|nr:hypothetical protein RF11_06246 [Thelohanellus kitauei]